MGPKAARERGAHTARSHSFVLCYNLVVPLRFDPLFFTLEWPRSKDVGVAARPECGIKSTSLVPIHRA